MVAAPQVPFQRGSEPAPVMSLAELERFFDAEIRLYQGLARDIGIQPE